MKVTTAELTQSLERVGASMWQIQAFSASN
jgi:hypothetical protein